MRGFIVFNVVVGIFTKGNQRFACLPKWCDVLTKGSYINELAVIVTNDTNVI